MSAVFVVGVGPGIGTAVARRFAADGLSVGLVARSEGTVERAAAEVSTTGVRVATATADAADEKGLRSALESLVDSLGVPEVLVYNAAVIRPDSVGDLDQATLLDTYAVNVGGAVTTAATLLPHMAGGSYLLTAGMPHPLPELVSLSLGKAGLRALADLLQRAHDRIHVATVTVCGPVAPGTRYDPDLIAGEYARLHAQRPDGWELDVRVGDPADAAG